MIDPKPEYGESTYSAMGNNPILHNDQFGDTVRKDGITNEQLLGMLAKGLKANEKTNPYSFNKSGDLQVDKKLYNKLSPLQKEIAKNISGAIDSKVTFTIKKVSIKDVSIDNKSSYIMMSDGARIKLELKLKTPN